MKVKRYYTHDCANCVSLGPYLRPSTRAWYDLYQCGNEIVARFGSDGGEYYSCGVDSDLSIYDSEYPLLEAQRRV